MSNISTVGERIAQARRELGVRRVADITPAELAKEIGVTPATVYRWESNEKAPSAVSLAKLADVLGVTRSYLAFGEGPKEAPRREPPLDYGVSAAELREIEAREEGEAQAEAAAAKKRRGKRA